MLISMQMSCINLEIPMYNLLKSSNVSVVCIEGKVLFIFFRVLKYPPFYRRAWFKLRIDLNSFHLSLISLAFIFP